MSVGLIALLITQFLSALADNAILFAAIALIKAAHAPSWNIPLLQEFFVAAYILLAPFVGPVADSFCKARVLLFGTALKVAGAGGLLLGVNPFICYGIIGAGAAVYSPAKYGVLSELASEELLVKANGWLESSTIAAILLGAIAGGKGADLYLYPTIAALTIIYVVALLGTFFVPCRRTPAKKLSFTGMLVDFVPAVKTLWQDREARFPLVGTGLFWGTGAVLRFLLIAWVPAALAITGTAMVGYLNAATAAGIVVGAVLAGQLVSIPTVGRVMPAGMLLGLVTVGLSLVHHLPMAFVGLAVIGALGGFFVVPLNALIQEKGKESVGAGRAVAVQNFFENLSMLLMIGVYLLLAKLGVAPSMSAAAIGIGLTVAMVCLKNLAPPTAAAPAPAQSN